MGNKKGIAALLIVWVFLVSACGKPPAVGEGIEIDESGKIEICRLGEKCPTPSPQKTENLGVGASPSPSPVASPTKSQEPAVTVIIPEGANYEPFAIEMEAGALLKVVNKDCRPEVPKGRSFTDQEGNFDSGLLKCNEEWLWVANVIGQFTVIDKSGFPANASLTIE